MTKRKEHHPNRDFFVADIFDNLPFKDDMASMEHPLFSLSKKKDTRIIEYKHGNAGIKITPSVEGLPTIFDKDILLYCGSLLMAEVNAGRVPPRTLRISTHDLLIATNRIVNGDSYERLRKALERLKGASIQTNIKTNKREIASGFGLIDSWQIIESSRVKNRMLRLEITLSEWFYNSIVGKEVLTINRDYFRLGKPMERRLYEIARKHCGTQAQWTIGLIPLMDKVGSTGTLRLFRSRMKKIATDSHLPDYSMTIDNNDKVTFGYISAQQINQLQLGLGNIPTITQKALKQGRELAETAGLDFYTLQTEFSESIATGFVPDNASGAFVNFIKKKVAV